MTDSLLQTPLHARHVAEGGRMVPFAGYSMPVQYSSIIAEAKAVRASAGMFDVSHMARLTISGGGALQFLERVTANDVSTLTDGVGQYSLLPNDRGGCVDDIIVYRIGHEDYRMVVNAANHAKDLAWLRQQNREEVQITDQTSQTFMIAVQGPSAVEILAGLSDSPSVFRGSPAFGVVNATVAGVKVFAARSGYTGEDGYEVIGANADADKLWQALRAAGVAACGLASRDTLRVEAGLPLYGHELNDDINPISAGLGWVIGKTKKFIGSDLINAAREFGTPTKLQGVRLEGKRLTMPDMEVKVEGRVAGLVTSGVYSPLLDCGIAFAFIDSEVPLKTTCTVNVRGAEEPGMIVSKRFFKRPTTSA